MKKYNASNARLTPIDARIRPSMSMQPFGQFRVNRPLLQLLGLKHGDTVEIMHDNEAGEWYITDGGKDGLPLCKTKNTGATFNSVVVREAITESAEVDKGRFDVLTEPVIIDGAKCYCILAGSAKAREMKKVA